MTMRGRIEKLEGGRADRVAYAAVFIAWEGDGTLTWAEVGDRRIDRSETETEDDFLARISACAPPGHPTGRLPIWIYPEKAPSIEAWAERAKTWRKKMEARR